MSVEAESGNGKGKISQRRLRETEGSSDITDIKNEADGNNTINGLRGR